jgi:hypothetical protein
MVENQRWFSLFFHVENHHFDGPKGLEMRFLGRPKPVKTTESLQCFTLN